MERYVITGGAGFIGINAAAHYLRQGKHVALFDNFSRAGAEDNVRWLQRRYPRRVVVVEGDIRHPGVRFGELIERADVVLHLAAQVAVTTSVTDPREDFDRNALGTFNILEAIRCSRSQPALLYSSTNKVYGKMADVPIVETATRYTYRDDPHGIAETRPLDFFSPYGCSKGTGDQYVLDYARTYGLRTVVFRQSCIYGPRQFGIEDQGWVAWFAIRALQGLPVTIYGDGKQVRDVLYIDDLIAAYDAVLSQLPHTSGEAYNIGGGPAHTLSLLELVDWLGARFGRSLVHDFAAWRTGDQQVFISDIRKAREQFGWVPQVRPAEGLGRMLDWLRRHEHLLAPTAARLGTVARPTLRRGGEFSRASLAAPRRPARTLR